jgi:hypothetical protein
LEDTKVETLSHNSEYLALEQCIGGHMYLLRGRGSSAGVCVGGGQEPFFIGIHEHMGNYDTMAYYHEESEGGTVQPYMDLGPVPEKFSALTLKENTGSESEKQELYLEFLIYLVACENLGREYELKGYQEVINRAIFENSYEGRLDDDPDGPTFDYYIAWCNDLAESIMAGRELIELLKRGETYNPTGDPRVSKKR